MRLEKSITQGLRAVSLCCLMALSISAPAWAEQIDIRAVEDMVARQKLGGDAGKAIVEMFKDNQARIQNGTLAPTDVLLRLEPLTPIGTPTSRNQIVPGGEFLPERTFEQITGECEEIGPPWRGYTPHRVVHLWRQTPHQNGPGCAERQETGWTTPSGCSATGAA